MAGDIAVGTYEGTGAAINVELGWVPDYVRVINTEDGDEAFDWFYGMGAADVLKATNHADTQFSLVTSNGVDAYEPTNNSNKKGFTVGTALSESGKTYRYIALRNGQY